MQATIQNEFLSLTVDTHGAEAVGKKFPDFIQKGICVLRS